MSRSGVRIPEAAPILRPLFCKGLEQVLGPVKRATKKSIDHPVITDSFKQHRKPRPGGRNSQPGKLVPQCGSQAAQGHSVVKDA